MRLPSSFLQWSIAASLLAFGCTPSIGDSCKLHTDCSANGDRLCEPNLPGGYCTIFNCEPDSCPSEAACVAFGVAPSTKQACEVTQQQRLERTFCMARCSSDSSCRSGYSCVDLSPGSPENVWGAAIVDPDRGSKVCTVAASVPAETATKNALASASSEVCAPPDASFPPVPLLSDAGRYGIASDGSTAPTNDARVPAVDAGAPAADAGKSPPAGP